MKLLQRLFSRKPVPKTEEEIAALIEGSANGTGGRWDTSTVPLMGWFDWCCRCEPRLGVSNPSDCEAAITFVRPDYAKVCF